MCCLPFCNVNHECFLHTVFEEPEDPTNRCFFSEIISSISDVKFSNSGRYMISRDYLSVKVWDLHMETKPIETYPVRIVNVNLFGEGGGGGLMIVGIPECIQV